MARCAACHSKVRPSIRVGTTVDCPTFQREANVISEMDWKIRGSLPPIARTPLQHPSATEVNKEANE